MIYVNNKLVYVVILLFIVHISFCQRRKLNSRCKIHQSGARGTCLLPTDCPRIQEESEGGIQPTKCGQYSVNVPIICCEGAHPIFNTPRPPNENSLLNLPEGLVYPGIGDGNPDDSPVDEGTVGYTTNQKCREYLPMEQYSFTGLALDNDPITYNVTKCTKAGIPLIVGGEDVDPGEIPCMAAIGWPNGDRIEYSCGGTLISNEYVLTVAHCSFKREVGKPTVVRLGATSLRQSDQAYDENAENYGVADVIPHEKYTGLTHYNDIALVKLDRKISKWTNYIRPACLWTRNSFDTINSIVAGWGHLEEAGERSEILQKVTLQLYSKDTCQLRYRNIKKLPQGIPDTMICSGYLPGGRDTCQGDSGGPLLTKKIDGSCEYYLIGITSFGIGCAKVNIPGLYTRVSSYIGWIEKNVWNKTD